ALRRAVVAEARRPGNGLAAFVRVFKEAVSVAVAIGVVSDEDRARRIFEELRQEGFGPSRIAIRFLAPGELPGYPESYDPVGAAQFFGAAVVSLPATGYNLVGNSTTVDTSLSTLTDLLSTLAAREQQEELQDESPQVRLVIQVWGDGVERAAAIMREAGAYPVRIEWNDRLQDVEFGAELDGSMDDPFETSEDAESRTGESE
ncbi:MAG TPA: hypothetical protein VIL08_07550, partial [Limnochorda sp.]